VAKGASEPRTQGSIRKRGNTYQVRVYAGIDPVTGRANYLTGTGRGATQKQAENDAKAILRRLLTEVDEQRNARTKAAFGTALDAWLRVTDLDETTREGYETYIRRYIRPATGRCGRHENHRSSTRGALRAAAALPGAVQRPR
jgi:hypothetical protein